MKSYSNDFKKAYSKRDSYDAIEPIDGIEDQEKSKEEEEEFTNGGIIH